MDGRSGLVELVSKRKASERRWKVIQRVIKHTGKAQISERWREIVQGD
jgi:hypothetical protein